jgi:hypothetical protein
MNRNTIKTITIAALLTLSAGAQAWSGFDYDAGNFIEIEEGNLVRDGETIEYFDYENAEYRSAPVMSVDSDEVVVYDQESGEYRTFNMD